MNEYEREVKTNKNVDDTMKHAVHYFELNSLSDDKILDQTKLKAFAGDKCNKNENFVFDRVENIVGKGEIGCTSNLSFSHYVFKRLLSQTLKSCYCVEMG